MRNYFRIAREKRIDAGIFTFKRKRQPPVAPDAHRPVVFQIADVP
jgi:hypothetical protein